jgi:hypothetical protein
MKFKNIPGLGLLFYVTQTMFFLWDRGNLIHDFIDLISLQCFDQIPWYSWIIVAVFFNVLIFLIFRRLIWNDFFFLTHKIGIKRNFEKIAFDYIDAQVLQGVIYLERKVYGQETWNIDTWTKFLDRNPNIAIGFFDRDQCIGGLSLFPINLARDVDFIQTIRDPANEMEEILAKHPDYIANYGSNFSTIYIPGIALLPYRFRYAGIGTYMIRKGLDLFNNKYKDYIQFPLRIYSIATTFYGERFLIQYGFNAVDINQNNLPRLYVKYFDIRQIYQEFLEGLID